MKHYLKLVKVKNNCLAQIWCQKLANNSRIPVVWRKFDEEKFIRILDKLHSSIFTKIRFTSLNSLPKLQL